ncbi:hypothetical protein E2C01_054097 [Portunus trituberculatus]|uniref:Nucleic-acid-binding protein from transposon X-element n=1 Tax=Portunus trituberculatus TaxID=210409 RepID=A0A5B7GIZ1_PORTR|nr:hypothetical protein [Portunus trituberculatus]
MDTDAASHTSSPQPSASHRRVTFPEGHGKTLAQLYEWFMALLKQYPSLEPLMKEGRCRPYLTVNPRSAAYDMLVKEGFLGLTMTAADPDTRQQMVIVHGVSTAINRCVIAGETSPQLLGLIEGAVPSSVHLHGLGHFRVGLYTTEPDLCGHCCRFRHQSWKCKSAPRSRYCSGGHPSSRCMEKIHAGTRVVPLCCNCGGDHNTSSRHCPAQPRLVRESQNPDTTVSPSRVVFRPAPPPQYNVWANGTPSWSNFPALPLPVAQPSAIPPLPGAAAPTQSGAAHTPFPATQPPVPVLPRTATYYAAVAGVPATLQDVVQLLPEIRTEVRDLRVRVTALEQQWDAGSPLALSSQRPNLPARTSPIVCWPTPGPNQCLLRSSLLQITSPRVRQPVLTLIASPRVCRLVLGPGESSHRPQYSHRSRRPRPNPLSVPDRTPLWSGSPSVEADLVLDCNDMDTDEEEWVPSAARTLNWLQAELTSVTEELAWVHQQVSLSEIGGVGE